MLIARRSAHRRIRYVPPVIEAPGSGAALAVVELETVNESGTYPFWFAHPIKEGHAAAVHLAGNATSDSYVSRDWDAGDCKHAVFAGLGTFTAVTKAVTNVTKANPATVTQEAHGYQNGQRVWVTLPGMSAPSYPTLGTTGTTSYIINRTANTYQLQFADTTNSAAFTSGTTRRAVCSVTITEGAVSNGTALTHADVVAANPAAVISFGSFGSVSLQSLLAAGPYKTVYAGSQMIEEWYIQRLASYLHGIFQVKYFAGGAIYIRAIADNATIHGPADRTYIPTITINGVVVYSSSTSINHGTWTRYYAESYIGLPGGVTHARVQPYFDMSYWRSTGVVPNVSGRAPSEAMLNHLPQFYAQLGTGLIRRDMGGTGGISQGHWQIGLLNTWDMLFLGSGDGRAYRSVLAHAGMCGSFPTIFRSLSTHEIIKPSDYATWTIAGQYGGGTNGVTSPTGSTTTWELAHHGSAGYLAYLATGDHFYLDQLFGACAVMYLCTTYSNGEGINRLQKGQNRTWSWAMRSLATAVGIAPTGNAVAADYRSHLLAYYQDIKRLKELPGATPVGPPWATSTYNDIYPQSYNAWMFDFGTMSIGLAWDIQMGFDVAGKAVHLIARNYMYSHVMMRLGPTGADYFHFSRAGNAFLYASDEVVAYFAYRESPSFFDTGGLVWRWVFGSYNAETTNTLGGTSPPSQGNDNPWGILSTAANFLRDHVADAPEGALEAVNRLFNSTNYLTEIHGNTYKPANIGTKGGMNDYPNWSHRARAELTP